MNIIRQMEPWINKEEEHAVMSVLRSGWITEASKTREFEKMLSEFTKARYVSVMSNGTVTLFAALKALGIGRGDEVIVPDMTMVATPNAVILSGAIPILVDIQKDSLCIDPNEIEKAITQRTKAILPVAFNGRSPDMDQIMSIAKKHKLFVIEDAAQALGCYSRDKHIGTIGDIGSFSFSTPKIITTGQGGALVTNNKILYERIVRLKDFGRRERGTQDHDSIGYNFKFTDVQAAIGLAQMSKLAWRIKRKKDMYRMYKKLLHDIDEVAFIQTNLNETTPWFIDIFVPKPKRLADYLKSNKIETRYFYPAIHTIKPYRQSQNKYPISSSVSVHGLWLPSSSFLSNKDIEYVCKHIRTFYEHN